MPGFWLLDEEGRETHVNGDPDMSQEMLAELLVMFEAAYRAASDTLSDDDQACSSVYGLKGLEN